MNNPSSEAGLREALAAAYHFLSHTGNHRALVGDNFLTPSIRYNELKRVTALCKAAMAKEARDAGACHDFDKDFEEGERINRPIREARKSAESAAARDAGARETVLDEVRVMLEEQRQECLTTEDIRNTGYNAIRADELDTALINLRALAKEARDAGARNATSCVVGIAIEPQHAPPGQPEIVKDCPGYQCLCCNRPSIYALQMRYVLSPLCNSCIKALREDLAARDAAKATGALHDIPNEDKCMDRFSADGQTLVCQKPIGHGIWHGSGEHEWTTSRFLRYAGGFLTRREHKP